VLKDLMNLMKNVIFKKEQAIKLFILVEDMVANAKIVRCKIGEEEKLFIINMLF